MTEHLMKQTLSPRWLGVPSLRLAHIQPYGRSHAAVDDGLHKIGLLVHPHRLRWRRDWEIGAALGMDEGEFEGLHRALWPRLLRFAEQHVDQDTANDVAHQALIVVWEKHKDQPSPQTVAQRRQIEGLAFKVAYGFARNAQRTRRRESRLWGLLRDHTAVNHVDMPDPGDLDLPLHSGHLAVPPVLDELPPSEREVVSYFIEGYKVGEIAALLGRRPDTVSMRLTRARKRLRALLEAVHDGE